MALNETQLKLLELNKGYVPKNVQAQREDRVNSIKELMASGEMEVKKPTGLFSPIKDVKETFSDIGESARQRATSASEALKAKSEGKQGFLRTAFQTLGQGAGFISDTVGNVVKGAAKVITPEPVEAVVGKGVESVAKGVAEAEPVKKFVEYYQNLDEGTKRDLGALLGFGELATTGIVGAVSKEPVKQLAKKTIKSGTEKIAQIRKLTPEAKAAGVLEDVVPTREILTKQERIKALKNREDGGIFDEGSYKPTDRNKEIAQVIQRTIPEYNAKDTFLNKTKVVQKKLKELPETFGKYLSGLKVAVPKRELYSKVEKVAKETAKNSLLLEKSDPVVKNYLSLVKRVLNQVEGNPNGVWDLRIKLDDAYKAQKGKTAFASGKETALENIHKESRDELNRILKEIGGENAETFLKDYAALKEAEKTLARKAEKEPRSKFGRLKGKFPKISGAVGEAAQATPILGTTLRVLKK